MNFNIKNSNLKLLYFNIRGRGELIRMILYAANKDFEDVRVTENQWPSLKSQMPFGQLPVLEMTPQGDAGDKITLTESMAIARLLARELDLYGNTVNEVYLIERVNSLTSALQEEIYRLHLKKAEDAERHVKMDHLNEYFEAIEDMLKITTTKFIAGSNVTMADLQIINLLDTLNKCLGNMQVDCKPRLEKIKTDVLNDRPSLGKYLRSRPNTDF
uniref:glutathione transferase n=1 Tax=Ictalurus punctatus TaxID=7998 RepID=E3TFR5_ICTPU|nr:glutathione S-transferase class-mu 28 kda isozyme [Ictalurus punctatus]ADO29151.1 glutathione S-transferase class-mu 28 kda isozyme [Ictalurus punctatus]